MKNAIHMLCALSLFCALALNLTPEGRERRIMSFVCSVVLLASVFKTVKEPDWEFYALEKGQLRQREQDFLQLASERSNELQRIVIEKEMETYILNKAVQMQIPLDSADVTAQWSLEGIWLPYRLILIGNADADGRARLSSILEAELGVPGERQEWRTDGA